MIGRLVIVALMAAGLCGCGVALGEGRLHALCDQVLKDRLRSPATYNRISAQKFVRQMEPEAWLAADKPSDFRVYQAERAVAAGKPLQEISLDIRYDASNAFGVPIRASARCSFLAVDGDEGSLAEVFGIDLIRVDGLTMSEWRLRR